MTRGVTKANVGALAAAACYTASCPPNHWSFAAWLVPGLLLTTSRDGSARSAFAGGLLFGVAMAFGVARWTFHAALTYFAFQRLAAAGFVLGMWVVYAGIPYGLVAATYAHVARRVPRGAWPVLGAWLWVVGELLRARLLTGLPWELLGHTQFQNLTLIQIADLGGVYAVSFVMAFVSLVLAELLFTRDRAAYANALAALALLLAVQSYGTAARASSREGGEGEPHRIAIVQSNVANEFRWKRAFFERTLATYVMLSRRAVARAADLPDLVVWPENAADFYIDREPTLLAQMGAIAALTPEGLIAGGPRLAADGEARNAAYLVGPDGRIAATYDKRRLVPFAEYNPFGLEHVPGSAEEPLYTPGTTSAPFRTRSLRLGTLICYEVLFPQLVRDVVRAGADVLVNISNDAWLDTGDGAAPEQHFSMAVFRAVETRRFLVRAAATGISGFVSPEGVPYAIVARGTAGTSVGRVWPRHDRTFYVLWGDSWLVLGVVPLLALWTRGRRAWA